MAFFIGYTYQDGNDNGMSPVLIAGSHCSASLHFDIRQKKSINIVEVTGFTGRMRLQGFEPQQGEVIKSNRLQLDYIYLHAIKNWESKQVRLYIGGSWNTLGNLRYYTAYVNNAYNYDFSTAIGLAGKVWYNFNIAKKYCFLQTGFMLPFLSFTIRPAYASSLPEGFITYKDKPMKAFFKSGKVQTFNAFFRLQWSTSFEYALFNGNRLSLSYVWDYYSIKANHTVQMATHTICIGWLYAF